jgi:predicted nucleotidyltransferase
MNAEVDEVQRWWSASRVPCSVKDGISDFVLHALRDRTDISAVALFGSYARGTAHGAISDVDLLIVTESRADTRALRESLRANSIDISAVFRTPHELRTLAAADWSFVEHLRREHEAIMDVRDSLPELLSPLQPSKAQIRDEILNHAAKLDRFEDLEDFAG